MKRIAQCILIALPLAWLVACEDDAVQPLQKVEAKVGEAFILTGPASVSFTNLEGTALTVEVKNFTDHLVKGQVSPRTYVDISVTGDETTTYQVETGYKDTCYGQGDRLCNELSFEVKGQPLLLKFEEVYWSSQKESSQGVEYITVDSARLLVVRK
jgi:hypothetical protein